MQQWGRPWCSRSSSPPSCSLRSLEHPVVPYATAATAAVEHLRALPGRLVEVRCVVSLDLARARYRKRAAQRHAGHLDADRTEHELWGEPPHALGVGPVVEVDTSGSVDIRAIAASVVQRAVPTSDSGTRSVTETS